MGNNREREEGKDLSFEAFLGVYVDFRLVFPVLAFFFLRRRCVLRCFSLCRHKKCVTNRQRDDSKQQVRHEGDIGYLCNSGI